VYTLNSFTLNSEQQNKSAINILRKLRALLNKDQSKLQHRLVVFLFFVCLSTIFWLISTLSGTFTEDISYPVKYTNIPKGKVLIDKPPDHLILRIKGNGYTILRSKILPKKPLKFDVNSFAMSESAVDSHSVYILTEYAKQYLNDELKSLKKEFEIISVLPDTIFFRFTNQVNKYLKIEADIPNKKNLLANQYLINGKIHIKPSSILVSGPASILDTLNAIKTEKIELTQLTDTIEKTYQLQKIDLLTYSEKKVRVQIPVDRYTQLSLMVPLIKKNIPDSLELVTFPGSVKINYRVSLSQGKKVKKEFFRPYVDYNSIRPEMNKLTVHLDSLPPFIHMVQLAPKRVEYLIEKK
jgi:hypothetical protein